MLKIGRGIFGKLCRLAESPFYALHQGNMTDQQMLGTTFIKMSTSALETSQDLSRRRYKKNLGWEKLERTEQLKNFRKLFVVKQLEVSH